ncbi:MAG: hypothetical protein ABW166_01465 [Sedimenticola sp.]
MDIERPDNSIDLDALFDMLNLNGERAVAGAAPTTGNGSSSSGVINTSGLLLNTLDGLDDLLAGGEFTSDPS